MTWTVCKSFVLPHAQFVMFCECFCAYEGHIYKLVCLHVPASASIPMHLLSLKNVGRVTAKVGIMDVLASDLTEVLTGSTAK